MSRLDELGRGLAEFLSARWGEPVAVDNLQLASAGARRLNVLFDANHAETTTPLVATITPNPAMQVMDVDVEASTLKLAEQAGARAPHVYEICNDSAALGGPFFVTARATGETIPRRVLRMVEATPGLGAKLGRECGDSLARLHAVDEALASPALARPADGDPAKQGLLGVEELMKASLQRSPTFELTLRWLDRHCPPPPESVCVLHGDFRTGNVVVGEDGLRAVLDWEVGRIGAAMEDLAWLCMRMWRFRNDTLEVGGFATLPDLRAGYEAAGGRFDDVSFHWWKVMATLRWGLGLAGQAAAHLDGSVPSIVMAASGRRVAELEYDLLMLIRRSYA